MVLRNYAMKAMGEEVVYPSQYQTKNIVNLPEKMPSNPVEKL